MVYKITDLHSKPKKIKKNSFMQWIKVGRIWSQVFLSSLDQDAACGLSGQGKVSFIASINYEPHDGGLKN